MYHALYVFTLLFVKLFSHLPRIIEGYSLWINFYTNNYGICMECYIAMARSKGECSDLKGIVREFFNATRVRIFRVCVFFIQIVVRVTLKTKPVLTAITISLLFSSLGSAKVCVILLTDIQKNRTVLCPSYLR